MAALTYKPSNTSATMKPSESAQLLPSMFTDTCSYHVMADFVIQETSPHSLAVVAHVSSLWSLLPSVSMNLPMLDISYKELSESGFFP
jgi:hypothetical protein